MTTKSLQSCRSSLNQGSIKPGITQPNREYHKTPCDAYMPKKLESYYAVNHWIFIAKNIMGMQRSVNFTLVSVLLSTEPHSVRFSSIPPSSNPIPCTDCCKFLKYRIMSNVNDYRSVIFRQLIGQPRSQDWIHWETLSGKQMLSQHCTTATKQQKLRLLPELYCL